MKEVYKGLPCWEMPEVPPRWLESEKASQQGCIWAGPLGEAGSQQVSLEFAEWRYRKKEQGEQRNRRKEVLELFECASETPGNSKTEGKGSRIRRWKLAPFPPHPFPGSRETNQCFPTSYATIEQKGSLIYNTPLCLGQSASQFVKQSLSIILLACHIPSWGRQNVLGVCYPNLAATCK